METTQFTARIDARIMRVIRKQAQQNARSINEEMNKWLETALLAKAAQARKKRQE